MTLIAHAIAPAPPESPGGRGLRGRPLTWSEAAGLGLWSTDWESETGLGRADALEHHRVVERICSRQPCLPVRFGTAFATADAARASLESRASALHAALERVAGRTELALTLLWRSPISPAPPPPATAGPGRRYMEERRARYAGQEARRARATELVDRLVGGLSIDRALVWHAVCTSEDVAASLAVLVPNEHAVEWKARLERDAAAFPDVVAVVNGPWPPYTFARSE